MAKDKKLVTWSPFREVNDLHESIDRLFDESLSLFPRMPRMDINMPVVDVYQTDKDVVVKTDLPEVNEKDLDIEVREDSVLISGERKEEKEVKKKNYYQKESSYGTFSRVVGLLVSVQNKKARAILKDGVLTITIPKAQVTKTKVIKIKARKNN